MDREKQLRDQAKTLEIGAKAASGTPEADALLTWRAEVLKQLAEFAAGPLPDPSDNNKPPREVGPRVADTSAEPWPYAGPIDDVGGQTVSLAPTQERPQALSNLEVAPEPQPPIAPVTFAVS